MRESLVLAYGDHPDQYVRCRLAQNVQRGVAVLIHGGYWREQHTADLMTPLATDLARRGWATVNVEYRRGPQASWPAPLQDVQSACLTAVEWAAAGSISGPVIGVGHSVGGQLALLAGSPLGGVVALAPVTDASRIYTEALGDGAAKEYFGTAPSEDPGKYAQASPIKQVPAGRPILLMHGGTDARVPLSHSLDYLTASLDSGDDVTGYFPHQLSHLEAIDPSTAHWENAIRWMDNQVPTVSTS